MDEFKNAALTALNRAESAVSHERSAFQVARAQVFAMLHAGEQAAGLARVLENLTSQYGDLQVTVRTDR